MTKTVISIEDVLGELSDKEGVSIGQRSNFNKLFGRIDVKQIS